MTRPLGILLLAVAAPFSVHAISSADPAADPVMDSTRPHHERVQDYLVRAAQQMPEEHFAFRPTSEVRSFGEILAHIAATQSYFCSAALGEENPVREDLERTHTTKAALIEALEASFQYCDRAYSMSDQVATASVEAGGRTRIPLSQLILNIGHNNEHYGNLVTYMRMKGLVPPSSQPRS